MRKDWTRGQCAPHRVAFLFSLSVFQNGDSNGMTDDKEQNTSIQDYYDAVQDSTHIKMRKFHYNTDRAKLVFMKGYFPGEELEQAFLKCESKSTEEKFPHFEIMCKPEELVSFAKKILAFYSE